MLIAITHLLVCAVQYWLFAQSFNLILLQKKADQRNISILSSFKNKLITEILPMAKIIQELVAFVLKVT